MAQKLKLFWNNKILPVLKNKNSLFYYVVILIILGIAFFASSLFINGFTITPSGDYVAQDIPFYFNGYDDWHHFFATGEFPLWDSNTFLGADNISNNTFYYFFNPFFLVCILFPRAWLVQMMSITMIFKLVLAALFFRLLLKHFNVKELQARFFSICYGFGGWIVFYMWFNCYMEICTFFPLVLLGIEKVINKEKPYTLMIGLFLISISNFYFLVPVCIGSVIYALFRLCQTAHTRTVKDNFKILGIGILSFAVGLMFSAFFTIPAFMNALSYSRSTSSYLGLLKQALQDRDFGKFFGYIFDWQSYYSSVSGGLLQGSYKGYRVFYPLMSFLFPASDGRNVSILNVVGVGNRYDEMASSLFAYTPVILIFFASIFKSCKEHKWSHLLAIGFFTLALFTPFFYYFFMAFTSSYGRWEFLPYAFIVLYCAISYNEPEKYKNWYFDASFIIIFTLMMVCVYYACACPDIYGSYVLAPKERWAIIAEEIVLLIVTYIIFRKFQFRKNFLKYAPIILFVECTVMGVYFNFSQGYVKYFTNSFIGGVTNFSRETEIFNSLNTKTDELYDDTFYRVQSGRIIYSGTNIAQLENYNGISFFNSTYNSAQDQYLSWARISRSPSNWVGEAIQKKPLLDTFLGVKYYLTKRIETNYGVGSTKVVHVEPNIPFGYEKVLDYYDYSLYKNDNFIELGFSYDKVLDPQITPSDPPAKVTINSTLFYQNAATNELDNDYNFLHSAVLSTEDIASLKKEYSNEFSYNTLEESKYASTPNLYTYYMNNTSSNINTYNAVAYELSDYFDPSNPLAYLSNGTVLDANTALSYGKNIVVLTPKSGSFTPKDEKNAALFINKKISDDFRYGYFLIDDTNKVVTYDNNLLFDNYGWYRNVRSLYTQGKNITKIICVPYCSVKDARTLKDVAPSYIYRWQYDDYMNVINNLKTYPLTNVSHTTNTYTFKTNFASRRFVVLNVGYSKGWSVKAIHGSKETTLKTYNGNGGWVSFMAETGDTTYKVSYVTPYLKGGLAISGVSLIGIIAYAIHCTIKKKITPIDPKKTKRTSSKRFQEILKEELRNRN